MDEGNCERRDIPGVWNTAMILFLFGLIGLGGLWKENEPLLRVVIGHLPGEGDTVVDSKRIEYLDPVQMARIHGPPLAARERPRPVHTFG